MKRTLTLRSETLTPLDDAALGSVHGGAITAIGVTCPVVACVTELLSDGCYTSWCNTDAC